MGVKVIIKKYKKPGGWIKDKYPKPIGYPHAQHTGGYAQTGTPLVMRSRTLGKTFTSSREVVLNNYIESIYM